MRENKFVVYNTLNAHLRDESFWYLQNLRNSHAIIEYEISVWELLVYIMIKTWTLFSRVNDEFCISPFVCLHVTTFLIIHFLLKISATVNGVSNLSNVILYRTYKSVKPDYFIRACSRFARVKTIVLSIFFCKIFFFYLSFLQFLLQNFR